MEILLNHKGTVLNSRKQASAFRNELVNLLDGKHVLVFNFHDVRTVTNSWADECFGKLLLSFRLKDIQGSTTFINTNRQIDQAISKAFLERIGQRSKATV